MMQKHELRHLFKFKETFKEFWQKYCKTFDLDESIIFEAEKIPKKVQNYFLKIKSKGLPKIENTTKNVDNHLIISYQERKRIKKNKKTDSKESTELDTIEETSEEIQDTFYRKKKKIVAINFTSAITEHTVNRINQACKFKDLFTRDYLYYNRGGQDDYEKMQDGTVRKRFKDQLTHLQMTVAIREEVNKLSQNLINNIDNVSLSELKEMNKKIDTFKKKKIDTFKKLIDSARNLDLQAVEFLQKMSDDDFSTQKALNGAIINDNTMTTNGQLVVEGEKKKVEGEKKKQELTTDALKEDLEAIGNAVFTQQINYISQDSKKESGVIEGEIMTD
jgi:hypothetical protein